MPNVNREKFLQCLEAASPGLSPRDIVEQSSSFVFRNGHVVTFNDEVSVRARSPLPKDFTGAVRAQPLLEVLRKLTDEEVGVEASESELRVAGKGRKAGLRLEREVVLDLSAVEQPGEWLPLPPEFGEAVATVAGCAGKDESQFTATCVHVAPGWVEASDDFQLCRWRLQTGGDQSYLVRHTALKHVAGLGAAQFALTPGWVHFKAPGLVLSCRRYHDEYPDMTPFFKVNGSPAQLPKALVEAAERASIFTKENPDNDHVLVELRPGRLRLKGTGVYGWYSETKKLPDYDGAALGFRISPKLLADLVQKHDRCVLAADKLKVNGGKYMYVTALTASEAPQAETTATTED